MAKTRGGNWNPCRLRKLMAVAGEEKRANIRNPAEVVEIQTQYQFRD